MSVEAATEERDEREVAKTELKAGIDQLCQIIAVFASTRANKQNILSQVDSIAGLCKAHIKTLAKRPKRKTKNTSANLTNPCLVRAEFASYVKALQAAGHLGKVPEGPVSAALKAITEDNCSSLLVSTLLISCDNYCQAKVEGVTFKVTPLMQKHLKLTLQRVKDERQAAHDKDARVELFNEKNYSSAMNNVIASRLREGPWSKDDAEHESLPDDLAALQAYLKEHNATLRAKRN